MSGHIVAVGYIRDGTSIPIRSSARVSCVRKYATPAARHRFRSIWSSLRIGIAMIERVEQLREAEGVLRQRREFERPHHLIDDFVEPRRLEHERPQVARLSGQFVRRRAVERADDIGVGQALALVQLVKDVVGADHRVLKVGAGFALEAERLLDVEHDQLAA